jgi:dipeptidyl aminopeptidase/acylaminoacyl peptidase
LKWSGVIVAAMAWAGAARAAPLEAYGRLPSLEQIAISPGGDKLTYVTDVGGQRTIVVQTVDSKKPVLVAPIGAQKLRDLLWVDEQHVLITTSTTTRAMFLLGPKAEWYLASVVDLANHKVKPLLEDAAMNVIYGAPQPRVLNGRPTVFIKGISFAEGQNGFGDIQGHLALFAVDPITGLSRTAEVGSPDSRGWIIDDQGKVVSEIDYNEARQRWKLRVKQSGVWRDALAVDAPLDTPEVEGISADGASLLVDMLDKDQWQVRPLRIADGALGDPIKGDSYESAVRDPRTHRVIGGEVVTEKTDYVFFDGHDQAVWKAIQKAFPDEEVTLESWSDDRSRIVVHIVGPADGDVFGLVDLKSGATTLIGSQYKDLAAEDVAEVRDITYRASDGREIMAYLTLPKGREPKGLPLVVLPHGGPAARDEPGFDWWSQALASRGYAVLQPQFRGSSGPGADLLPAGYGEFGRKMQTDLSDGVRALAAKGTIDQKRVCIVGASYGGYAALAGATLDPGVYRCAVSVAGISDLRRFLAWVGGWDGNAKNSSAIRYWDRFMGARGRSDPALDEISPIKRLDKLAAPILLIHGRDDTVVPFEQSQIMADALAKAGKPVQFVPLQSEDHWLSRSETRLQMLQATVKFLEANNPPS